MDVGDPSNFERMRWHVCTATMWTERAAARRDRLPIQRRRAYAATIKRVYEEARLPPRSAQRDCVHGNQEAGEGRPGRRRFEGHRRHIFLATAHPASSARIVEPIIEPADRCPGAAGPNPDGASRATVVKNPASLAAVPAHARSSDEPGPFRYRPRSAPPSWPVTASSQPHRTAPDWSATSSGDLYKYEIRRLKARMLRGEFPRDQYTHRVEQLRDQYPVLALLPRQFVE